MSAIPLGTPESSEQGNNTTIPIPTTLPIDPIVLTDGISIPALTTDAFTIGASQQIPFVNGSGTDFSYDGDFTYAASTDTLRVSNVLVGTTATVNALLMDGVTVDTIETSLTNDDTHIPTSGAVFDAIGVLAHGNHTGQVISTGLVTSLHVSSITAQTDLPVGLVSTDELLVNDGGVLKRMDISVLQAYMQSELTFVSYTHPNHTGQVLSTGDGATVLDITAITAQTESLGLISSDEILVNDGGVISRADISVLQAYMQSSLTFYSHPNHSGQVTSTGDGATVVTASAITAQTELASGLASTDELLVSDNGVLKRMDTSVIQSYMEENISHLTGVDYINYNSGVTPPSEDAGMTWWNETELALNVASGVGPVLQMGQEIYFLVYNDGVAQIDNGTVLRPVGATLVGGKVIGTTEPALADVYSTVEGTLMVATMDIAPSTTGLATRLGRVRGFDTTHLTPGATAYVSPTVPGGLTNTRPEFPNYEISMGAALVSDTAPDGEFIVSVTKDTTNTFNNFFNGTFRESFSFTVSEAGGVVTGTLVPTNGNVDMTMLFSDGFSLLDTDPSATIVLTPGTDTVPVKNYVYVLQSTKVLTVSTSDFPSAQHIKVATLLLQSATTTGTEGAFRNQNWNDHIQSSDNDMGHLSHITEKLRKFEAQWYSGCELATVVRTAPAPDELYITVTGGIVYQLHAQSFPAFDTETTGNVHVVNDSVTAYLAASDLATLILDSAGVSLSNRDYSLVVWGVANKSGEPSHLFVNLPNGSYSSSALAIADSQNYSVYTIPNDFAGVGFLIARITLAFGGGTSTITVNQVEDLRGKVPNTSAGGGSVGGAGVTTFLGLTDVPASYVGEGLNVTRVNAGATALEFYDVDGAINLQHTGDLTDGAPTDAEIDSATGTTPAAVGAGWRTSILDTTGSALIYLVVSDGTNWQYTALTIAT